MVVCFLKMCSLKTLEVQNIDTIIFYSRLLLLLSSYKERIIYESCISNHFFYLYILIFNYCNKDN